MDEQEARRRECTRTKTKENDELKVKYILMARLELVGQKCTRG
jgi:hypothetical protein